MKIIVAVVVHNRIDNIKEWIRCFTMCNIENSSLVVIHNYEKEADISSYKMLCLANNVQYISRSNRGMDIGAFQDVCRQRLKGFSNNWDYLFWVTDDVIPMNKKFISIFLGEMHRTNMGVVCLEISSEFKRHIRTSGFMISRETAIHLNFFIDPITTKEQCYEFEHRNENSFFEQINKMGKVVKQVSSSLSVSYLWDIGHRKDLDRWSEHYKEFPNTVIFMSRPSEKLNPSATIALSKKVTFICPIYNTFPEIVSSLLLQTFDNWELYLIHDGKNSTGLQQYINTIGDTRIIYRETSERLGLWGFPIRRDIINQIKTGLLPDTDYIVVTNPDNYHTPFYIERYLMELCKIPDAIGAYCSQMVHNYVDYKTMDCSLKRGYIDAASIMFRKDVACDMGWSDIYEFHSDWIYIENIIQKYGTTKILKVEGCHLIHN